MTDTERLKDDIAYVRAAAEQTQTVHVRAHGFLWAAILLCGFALVDFAEDPRWIRRYWLFATPVGFVLSAWLGIRGDHGAGQFDRATGMRWMFHWLAFIATGLLGASLVYSGQLTRAGFGSLWVLLTALTYFQAGLHLDRRLLPVSAFLAGGYLATLFMPLYGWTLAGVLAAAALVAHALLGTPDRAPAS